MNKWPSKYLSEKKLRLDIECLVEAATRVILKKFKNKVKGIYFKGSASKIWHSPIDYVPGISDVDVHILLACQDDFEKATSTIEKVMTFNKEVEKEFFLLNKKPSHIPSLQLLSLNEMLTEVEYIPSLAHIVRVVHGQSYKGYDSKVYGRDFKRRGAKQILEHESTLKNIRKRGLYKYDKHLAKYLDDLSWRLSSSGPNFLCMNSYTYEEAWHLNRTDVVKHMRKLGQKKIAKDYHDFYMNCWKYYLTKNSDDCRKAIISGYNALDGMIKLAKNI